jgi:hypothetical protein
MAKSIEETEFSAENHEGRHSEGREGTKFTSPSASPKKGKLMPRKNTAAGDPAITNPGVRANAPYQGERKGAAYSIKATYMKQTAPEAGMTQANGRIVSPSIVRQKDSWSQGMESSY